MREGSVKSCDYLRKNRLRFCNFARNFAKI